MKMPSHLQNSSKHVNRGRTINSGESSLSRSIDVSTLTVQDSEDSPGKQKGQDDDKVVNVQVADALHEDDVKSEGDEDDDGVKDLKNNSNSRGSCYLSR